MAPLSRVNKNPAPLSSSYHLTVREINHLTRRKINTYPVIPFNSSYPVKIIPYISWYYNDLSILS